MAERKEVLLSNEKSAVRPEYVNMTEKEVQKEVDRLMTAPVATASSMVEIAMKAAGITDEGAGAGVDVNLADTGR